ncbi:MAG: hypothetical protein RLZZ200_1804 [Pseudomonadota bacterium]|jgi:predicted MFS family arabinose efflux permease
MLKVAQQRATRAAFFIPGFVTACWAPLVPFAKARASLEEAALGVVLLGLGVGSLLAMPAAGLFAARFGCRRVMLVAVAAMLGVLPCLALASNLVSLGVALLVFGASVGTFDCVMNVQAVVVERESGRSMMSGFHAFYSLGALAGAIVASLLLAAGATPLFCTVAMGVAAIVLAGVFSRAWRAERVRSGTPVLALPRGVVILIGIVCLVTFMAEGSVRDWSAVYLREVRGVALARAGWGFVAFNLAMTITRLLGDRVVDRLGPALSVRIGGLMAAAGFATAALTPSLSFTLAGYVLVGVGCANVVPVMFTLAGRQTRLPAAVAVPAVSTMGYAGVLSGPAVIGFIAQSWTLTGAFLLTALALAAAAILGSSLKIR